VKQHGITIGVKGVYLLQVSAAVLALLSGMEMIYYGDLQIITSSF
jgi:hypothetical protein